MKKQITAGIAVIACVVLCAAVWSITRRAYKNAVFGEIEARPEETPHIFISEDVIAPETKAVAESKPQITEVTAEEKTEKPVSTATPKPQAALKSAPASTEPKSGDRTVIDGTPYIWISGFEWILDEGGGSVGIIVGGKGDIDKIVGIMGGGDAPANGDSAPGAEKYIDGVLHVWVSGFGYVPHSGDNIVTYAEDMYESGVKIGIMGDDEPTSRVSIAPPAEQPELTCDVIYRTSATGNQGQHPSCI